MKHSYHTLLRRALALTIMLLLLVNLTGCWKKDDADSTGDSQNDIPSTSAQTPPETSSAPSTEPSTEAPTDAPTEAPTDPPATEAPSKSVMGTVTAAKLNIRKGAGSEYDQISTYFKNDRIEILETKDGWGRTDKGWVNLVYVNLDNAATDGNKNDKEDTPANTEKPNNQKDPVTTDLVSDGKTTAVGYGVVTLETLNVRTGPGTNYDKINTVSLGNRYAYYQKSGNWVRIKHGWISTTYFYIEGTTGDGAGNGTITGTDLNIRTGPGTGFDKVGAYKQGDAVKILAQVNGWGYTSKGWISMKYVEMEKSTTPSATTGKATITGDKLNIRKDADIKSDSIGQYNKGDKVEILETKNGWGRTDKGWISLQYVKMDETEKKNTGTISVNTGLHIRKEPNKTAEILGSYKNGDKVTILETKDGWGKTDKGWISMDYVKMDT